MVLQDKPECCNLDNIPCDCPREYFNQKCAQLAHRHKSFQPKRGRIKFLAIPKYIEPKFRPSCPCHSTQKTEIIRELPCHTRTEQLAYPCVRKLMSVRREFGSIMGAERRCVLNRTIRKSLLLLYSRLANVQAPKEKECICGWTKKEWAIHRSYLKKLARPKKIFRPPKPVHIWKELKLLTRYRKLCKPKKRIEHEMPKWELTDALKKYKPTKRIELLSIAKDRDENVHFQPLPIQIKEETMRYKATERIKQLATAPEVRLGESDLKENPFGIAPNALKAKCSDRVAELSKPKEHSETHTREQPFIISPAALKAKASPRIIELSKPKGT